MFGSLCLVIVALLFLLAVFVYFRAEGFIALFLIGIGMIFILADRFNVTWTTAMTGTAYLVFFQVTLLWWWLAAREPLGVQLQRKYGFAVVAIMALWLFWEIKHTIERQSFSVVTPYEYYKWLYMMSSWAAPFVLGILFPLSQKRLRRLFLAVGMLGLALIVIVLLFYVTGQKDYSRWGVRYTPAERLDSLQIGITGGIGISYLLAYLVLRQKSADKLGTFRTLLLMSAVGIMFVGIGLTGSRGPFAAALLTVIFALFVSGGRAAVRIGIACLVTGTIVYLGIALVPSATLQRLAGIAGREGLGQRWHLLVESFNILNVAPGFGQTLNLRHIIGIEYSHQITTQVMVEMGLVGFALYLMAFVSGTWRWIHVCFLRRASDVWLFAGPLSVVFFFEVVQRNAAGHLASGDIWFILGMLMGHRLRRTGAGMDSGYVPAEELIGDQRGYATGMH